MHEKNDKGLFLEKLWSASYIWQLFVQVNEAFLS